MNRLRTFVMFLVGALVAMFSPAKASTVEAPAPTNSATLQFEHLFQSIGRRCAILAVKAQLALDRLIGFRSPVFGLSLTADEQILKSLETLNERVGKMAEIEKAQKEQKESHAKLVTDFSEFQKQLVAYQKQLVATSKARVRRGGQVSDDCAAHLGAVSLILGVQCGKIAGGRTLEMAESEVKNILGIELKSALTASDIPLPVQYSAEVAELVYEYGVARKVGTVFPLGTASVKLPKLSSSPTFGLIAMSGTVTEKSPQVTFVTFSPEKFGGLIRLPSEIEADSIVAMGQFLARYSGRQMAQVEDYNFFRSTGAASGQNGTAKGLLVTVNGSNDNILYIQGNSASSGKTKPSDATLADYRGLRAASGLNGAVLQRAKYYMHPTYEQALVAFNTSATVQPYQRGTAGQPATLDGFEIVWVPDMPAYSTSAAATTVHVLFGDASFQYLGVRAGFAFDTSREAAFGTDEVLVRALERFTVGKMASDCMAGLITSTT